MKKTTLLLLSLIFVLGVSLSANADSGKHRKSLAKHAKITKQQAQETALKEVPGQIVESDLEREHGKLLYSFDIKTKDGIKEVQIDALDGKLLGVEAETKEHEAQEKAADQKKAGTKK